MGQLILDTLGQTMGNFFNTVALFLPHLLSMLVIIVAGFIVAVILKVIVRRIFSIASFRKYCDSAGLTQMMRKAALPDPIDFLGKVVFWVVLIVFIVLGVDALGISAFREQISRFFMFLPQIFVAMLVLFIGLLVANFFSRATLLAATNANYHSARLLSSLVRLIIIIFFVTMALEQIGLGRRVVLIAFSLAFGALMLGTAIAFGLGGRDVARRFLEKQFVQKEETAEKDEEISPL
jgi:glucose-6-phosphate-specific signal transduction histidine kinase